MRSIVNCFAIIPLIIASTTNAQHADVRPHVVDGQIQTAGFEDSSSTELLGLRVFGYDFGEDPAEPFFTQDPGFNAAAGSGLPGGSQLLFNIVGSSSLGLPANLSYWDGNGGVAFTAAPAGESLTLSFGSQNRVADAGTGFVAGFSLQTVAASGVVHRHLNAFLAGAGGDPSAGIYLLPLELESSDTSIQKSLPFLVLYNNGLDEDAHDAAIEWVQENLVVPEASSLMLAVIGSFASCATRRRKRD
jgi:hypothetical protein